MQLDPLSLRADITRAFASAHVPARKEQMLAEPYRSNEEAYELAVVLFGRAWDSLSLRELFPHRQMIFALSPEAFRAYLPAYLSAAIAEDSSSDGPNSHGYRADVRQYLVNSLIVEPDDSAAVLDLSARSLSRPACR